MLFTLTPEESRVACYDSLKRVARAPNQVVEEARNVTESVISRRTSSRHDEIRHFPAAHDEITADFPN